MKTQDYKVGDIVRHTSKFLRSVGWHTNVPINGLVYGVGSLGDHQLLTVKWNDREGFSQVIGPNVEICPIARRQLAAPTLESMYADSARNGQ